MSKFISFNTDVFPFNNANIRKAFSYAINRKGIVKHITQLQEEPAFNIIPTVLLPEETLPLFADADEKKAREYLKKGCEELKISKNDLKNLCLTYVSTETNHLLTQEIQDEWLKVLGVEVKLENVEFKVLHERSARGEYQMGIFMWLAEYGDPMNILERFQDKKNHRNYSKWVDPKYDEILDLALNSSSPQERFEKIQEAERFLIDQMPVTCLFHGSFTFLIQPHVKGFAISPLGQIYFDQISIDPKPASSSSFSSKIRR